MITKNNFYTVALLSLTLLLGYWFGLRPRQGDVVVLAPPMAERDIAIDKNTDAANRAREHKVGSLELLVDGTSERSLVPPVALDLETLPPFDPSLPLSMQLEPLLERLSKGDPVAACRIAVDRMRCESASLSVSFGQDLARQAARGKPIMGESGTINLLATREEQMQSTVDYCGSTSPDSLPEISEFPQAALDRLSTRQKVIFALLRKDGSVARFPRDTSDPSHLSGSSHFMVPQFIGENAWRFLREGMTNADPLALEGMLIVSYPFYDPAVTGRPGLSMPNPELFARHALLAKEVIGGGGAGQFAEDALQAILQTLTPQRVDVIRAQAKGAATEWKSRAAHRADSGIISEKLDSASVCLE